MKIIFVDIDGVFNHLPSEDYKRTCRKAYGNPPIDRELVGRFNKLLEATGAYWVLASSRRHDTMWRLEMFTMGLDVKKMIDKTPYLPGQIRGKEIDKWLSQHTRVERYAIIDDDTDMMPWHGIHFFHTNFNEGLTEEIAERVRLHLLGKDDINLLDDPLVL